MREAGIRNYLLPLISLVVWNIPAFAQIDLAGAWGARLHEDQAFRGPGPDLGEYEGIPLNEAGRLRAESFDAGFWEEPERQCAAYGADLQYEIDNAQIWNEVSPLTHEIIAWHNRVDTRNIERTWWMDGRPHPSEYAPHTWVGFSTAKWEGPMLTVTTTHLKQNYIERNGVMRSDKATLVEHYIRHGNYLTVVQITTDPVYFTEPLLRSRNLVWDPFQRVLGYSCRSAEEVSRPKHFVPHRLPGTNTALLETAIRRKLPREAIAGGAETMYPEFMIKMKSMKIPTAADMPASK